MFPSELPMRFVPSSLLAIRTHCGYMLVVCSTKAQDNCEAYIKGVTRMLLTSYSCINLAKKLSVLKR